MCFERIMEWREVAKGVAMQVWDTLLRVLFPLPDGRPHLKSHSAYPRKKIRPSGNGSQKEDEKEFRGEEQNLAL